MTSKKKIVIAVVIVAVIAAAAALGWFLHKGASGSSGGVYVQPVSDVNSASSGFANRYSGIIETQKTENVQFDTSKTLKELLVAEGDRVYAGDPLFTYDTQSTELDIQQAELEIEQMNTTIANDNAQIAQLQKDMNAAASADKLGFSAQIQQLQAEIAQTEYNIKSKQAEIDKLNASIENATICATMDGTVDSIADLDTLMSGGGDYTGDGSGNAYITILADGDYRVKGTVSEQNIYEIAEGMPVIVRSRVDESVTWTGTIASIDTQAESDDNNYYYSAGESASNYPFYVDLDSIDGLMLGQHVTIEIDYGQAAVKDGIWLSSGWIVQNEDGSAYVWAAKTDGAKLEQRAVELGDYDPDMDEYQILSGLDESEYIAWPDVDCVAGAATTTEYIVDESEFDEGLMDGEMTDGEVPDDVMWEDGEAPDDVMWEDGEAPDDVMWEDGEPEGVTWDEDALEDLPGEADADAAAGSIG